MIRLNHLTTVPEGPFRFIAIDVETAGARNDSICQIGLCFVGEDHSLQTYSTLVNPQSDFAPFNVELHGISAEMVRTAPTFAEAFAELSGTLNAHPLVQHSRFDEKAMDAACKTWGQRRITSHWVDSVQIARKAWPELKGNGGHGLGHLKKVLGLQFRHHDAGEDARAAASVILAAEEALGHPVKALSRPAQMEFDLSRAPRL